MESHSVAGLAPNGPLGLLGLQEPADWFDDDDGGGDDGDCVGSVNSDGGDDVLPASRST